MTVLFSDYINGGPLGTWDSTTGTFSIVQSSLFTDGYGVQLSVSANNSWSSLNKGVQSNSAIFNCRISIVLPAVPTAGDELEVINSSYNGECRMILTPQGVRMQNWIDDSVTSVSWVANRRYFLELEFKRDATAGFVHLYLDGTLIYSKTGATGLATYANFAIGLRQSGSWENVPRSVIIGDVVMADAYIGITEVPMFIDISPLTATITAGDTQQFQSTVSNAPSTPTVTWIDADTSAVLGTGATYSFTGQTAGTYRLFARATAGSQTADSAVATITVVSGGTGTEYTVMAGAVWKTALATGTENHYWGQLGNGAIGLQGKQIWLNIDGVTQTSVRPFTGFTYPVTTLADGGIDLCWYMDIPGVYAVCAEFLGDDVYAPCKGPVFYVNVGNVQPPDTYEPPGPNTPAYITTGFWKTSVNKGSENHIWGQLSDGIQGVGGRKIWLNVNGLTKTDAKPFNPPQYAYPCITNPDGGFDLCWIMEETGTFNIAAEFLGETWASGNSLLPIKGTITPIQVLGLYNPPITPVTQNAPNPDRRIRNDRVAISCNPMFIYDNPQKLADYIASGSAWTRIELNWMNLEANGDGVFHFTNDMYGDNTDLAVQAMFDNHIALVGLLDYGNPAYTGAWNNPPTTQTQIDAWLRFVRAVVERYKDKIAYWEIWNEPNAPNFWGGETTGPGMGGNAVNYSNLLKQTSTLIRSIDPTAKIMTAGIWGSDCLFIKTIYEQGCKDYFDIMTLHPYGGIANFLWGWYNLVGWDPATWGAYSPFDYCVQAKVWEIMRHYGDGNKPMWITEYCDYAVADTSNEVWGDYVGIDPVQLWDVGLKMGWNFINDQNIDFTWASNLNVEAGYTRLGNFDKYIVFHFDELYTNGVKNVGYTYFQQLATKYNLELAMTNFTLTITSTMGGTTNPSGSLSLAQGTVQSVSASANNGYVFDHWMLDNTNVGNANPYSVTMDADHLLTPVFVAIMRTLTILPSTGGTTNPVSGTYSFTDGSVQAVTATPTGSYLFSNWLLDGNDAGTNLTIYVTMDANHSVQPVFVAPTVAAQAGGPYSASIRNPVIQFEGSVIGGIPPYTWNWNFGDGSGTSNAQSPAHVYATAGTYTAIMTVTDSIGQVAQDTADVVISALLPPIPQFTWTPTSPVAGQQVTFDASGSYVQEPNSSILTYSWQFGDSAIGTGVNATHVYADAATLPVVLTITDTLGQSNSITHAVNIGQPPHLLTLNVVGNGTLTAYPSSANGMYPYGTHVDVVAIPSVGYMLQSWTDNGTPAGAANTIGVEMTTDHDVTATFVLIPPNVWVLDVATASGGGGTTSVVGKVEVVAGQPYTVEAIPAQGYSFNKWTLDGVDSTDNPITVPVQTTGTSHTLTATFLPTPIQAGFPWWVVAVAGGTLVGGYYLSKNGKKPTRR